MAYNVSQYAAQVFTYTYHNETDEWKQLGQYFTGDFEVMILKDMICLSPHGKFMGLIYFPFTMPGVTSLVRVFALREDKINLTTNATTTTEYAAATMISWEQVGPDIVYSSGAFTDASLTDNLVLAVATNQSSIYVYQFDQNQSNWVRMGQEVECDAPQSMELAIHKNTGRLLLAVGGSQRAFTWRYVPENNKWIPIGSVSGLAAYDEESKSDSLVDTTFNNGVLIRLSMDGETMTVGPLNDADKQGTALLRTYSYDAETDDWWQLGQDLHDSTFFFGLSFSLSANGKVLVATRQNVDVIRDNLAGFVVGQVCTFDYIAASAADGGGGEWIQRGAVLEVGTSESGFGWKIALSADGNRLATRAPTSRNAQGEPAGKVRVFEQY